MANGLLKKTKLYHIDFSETTDTFNPLDVATKQQVQRIAQAIIRNGGVESKSDQYWATAGEKCLQLLLELVVFHLPKEYCNMANVVRLAETFAANPEQVDRLVLRSKDEALLSSYKALNATGSKTLSSIVSVVLTSLKIFSDPDIARTTSKTTIPFEKFRTEKSCLIINLPVNDVSYYAPFTVLLYEHVFRMIMSKIPSKHDNGIFCLIDELVAFRFQNLGLVFSNIRKFRGGCMGLIQDERMLEMHYTQAEAHALKSNCYSKVYLSGASMPLTTCKALQDIIGNDENHKPVLAASQIRIMKEAIILFGNEKPFLQKMIFFYDHWILKNRVNKCGTIPSSRKILVTAPLIYKIV